MDDEPDRHGGDLSDRLEIALRVVGKFRVQARNDAKRGVAHEQRITVGCRFRNEIGSDRRPGAGTIVDHDLPAQPFAVTSVPPPGGYETIRRMGRSGYACPSAAPANTNVNVNA